jgi:hypothetical protein
VIGVESCGLVSPRQSMQSAATAPGRAHTGAAAIDVPKRGQIIRRQEAGGARGASRSGSTSVTTMHALFTRKVECKMASGRADLFLHSSENFESHDQT